MMTVVRVFGFLMLTSLFATAACAKTLQSKELRPVLLELYSSQGCSSCPPAEAWLNGFKTDERLWHSLIPINFHVDYWDYLGWPDPYSNALFSDRQRLYRRTGHTKNVATPGFVVDGRGWNGWFARQRTPMVQVTSPGLLTAVIQQPDHRQGDVSLTYTTDQTLRQPLTATVAVLGFDQTTQIPKGENRGRELRHDFVVLKQVQAPLVVQNGTHQVRLPMPDVSKFHSPQQALVVWVSQWGDPRPLQVVADWL